MPKNILFLIRPLYFLLFVMLFSLYSTSVVSAQDEPDPSAISPELQKEVNTAKARKEIAEARKAELEAAFPIPDAESLRTSTEFKELKGEFIESRIQGYKAMSKVATEIACRSRGHVGENATLVIYRPEEAAMLQNYLSVIDKQKQLLQWYEELIKEAQQHQATVEKLDDKSLGGFVAPFLGVVGDLAALFQRKESYTPTLFDITEKELVAVFFNHFKNAKCESHVAQGGAPRLFYPGVVPISVNSFKLGTSDLLSKVVMLDSKHKMAETMIQKMVTSGDQNKNNKNLPVSEEKLNEFIRTSDELKFRMETLREVYKGFLKEIGIPYKENTPPNPNPKPEVSSTAQPTTVTVNVYNKEEEKKKTGGGGGDFYSYLQAEKLYKLMNDPAHKGYWIQMSVTKAGGNVRVVSIPIVDIFAGSRVRFSGGAIVTYSIFNLNGQTELSGIVQAYEEYTSSQKIKKSVK